MERTHIQDTEALAGAFLDAMSRVASTVGVVTTNGNSGWMGTTVSAMSSVSADKPNPILLICLHRGGSLGGEILQSGNYCVNILAEDQSYVSDVFAGRQGHQQEERFAVARWLTMRNGAPGLKGSVAQLGCRVADWKSVGSHYVIFGAVEEIRMPEAVLPLIYTYRNYARLEPLPEHEDKLRSA